MDIFDFVLIGTGLVYSILDTFDLLSQWPILTGKSAPVTLALICTIMIKLVLSNKESKKINSNLTELSSELGKIARNATCEVQRIDSSDELYNQITIALRGARKSVCDLTWGELTPTIKNQAQKDSLKAYYDELINTIAKPGIVYREVMTFPNKRRLARIDRILNNNHSGYHLKYYDLTPEEHKRMPPLMQFLVIDEELVIFNNHRGTFKDPEGEFFAITDNKVIVDYFLDYFGAIWAGGKSLINITGEDVEKINSLKASLPDGESIYNGIFNPQQGR